MAKDIVILLDGTSNQISRKRSNVLRLYGTLEKGPHQVVFYDPGVGTFGTDDPWSRFRSWRKEKWGQATGVGLDENVLEAYQFLCTHYDHGRTGEDGTRDCDRIWLFGFSRGAYSARMLAGFLRAFGLIAPEQMNLLKYAWRAYKSIGEPASEGVWDEGGEAFAEIRLHERVMQPLKPHIHCMAMFDTVASVIEPGRRWFMPQLRSHAFTSNNTAVRHLRHAVALDERRRMFRPRLWGPERKFCPNLWDRQSAVDQDVREVWFAGVHGDIGGGYPESGSGLGKLPLDWIIEETRALGLRYRTATVNKLVKGERDDGKHVAPDPLAAMHVSLKGAWWVLEYLPSRKVRGREFCGINFPLGAPRVLPEGAEISPHVWTRHDADESYRPPNLPPRPAAAPPAAPAAGPVPEETRSTGT